VLIDIGANLTHDSFDHDLDEVMQRAFDAGVKQLVVTGASANGSEQAAKLARGHEALFATAGIHPHHAEETNSEVLGNLAKLAEHDKVVAIGETGLDFFRDFSPRPTQIKSFEQHIALAVDSGLPMFLHERDAHPTFGEVLGAHRDELSNVVVHCFTGEKEALFTYLDLDCYIGITGWICDERRGANLLELVKEIPRERLLLETDAPYLMPRTLKPKPKTRRNEPQYLTEVCRTVARVRDMPYEELALSTSDNARRFFGIPSL
jgi:TatD DNase family protein